MQSATSLQQLNAIIENSDDAIISRTLSGVITGWNPAAEKILGYTAEEIIGQNVSLFIPEEFYQDEEELIKLVARGEKILQNEVLRLHKNGSLVTMLRSISPIKDETGNVISAVVLARDVTEQRRMEQKQYMQSAIMDSSDDAIISKSPQGIITSWNIGATHIFGYTEDEALGRHITMLIPPDRISEETHIIGKILKGERIDHFETIRVTKDGRLINVSLTVSPVKNKVGEIIGASKIARDVTRQKQAEDKLQRYAENLEILNSVGKFISEDMEVQNILQKVTDATTQLTGAAFGAFFYNMIDSNGESYMLYTLSGVPRSAFENFDMPRNTAVFHPTFSGQGTIRVDDITKDERYAQNPPHYGMPKGHLPVVSYLAVPVISKTGTVIGGLFYGHPTPGMFTKEHEGLVEGLASQAAIALDNAQLYQEVQVLNKRKDEFIGLASHELKTPVTSINGYLQIIDSRIGNDELTRSFTKKAKTQVAKLSALINDLLDVSKIQTGQLPLSFAEFDLVDLVRDVNDLMQYSNTSHHIVCCCAQEQLIVRADRQRIEQVLINLISNAVKYSPGAKQVLIDIDCSNDWAIVAVKDFGLGIDRDHQQQIFSRFYRVNDIAAHISGLGVGLYISKEIIERHNGRLRVKSKLGEGSVFTFELPLIKTEN